MRSAHSALLASFLMASSGLPGAQPAETRAARVTLVVQSTRIAGFHHYDAASVWDDLREGDSLELVREPDNRHDANAVRIEWRGRMLGYVPRRDNRALAWALDSGQPLRARIVHLQAHPNPARRIALEITME